MDTLFMASVPVVVAAGAEAERAAMTLADRRPVADVRVNRALTQLGGIVVAVEGPIAAGKSHLIRLIRHLARVDKANKVPKAASDEAKRLLDQGPPSLAGCAGRTDPPGPGAAAAMSRPGAEVSSVPKTRAGICPSVEAEGTGLGGALASGRPEDQARSVPPLYVHREHTNPQLLAMQYADPRRYALLNQVYMLTIRQRQMKAAMDQAAKKGAVVFMDRSLVGDAVFCQRNVAAGHIDAADARVYRSLCEQNTGVPLSQGLDLLVYLDVEPVQCLHRVQSIRGDAAETGLRLADLEAIERQYLYLLLYWLSGQAHPYGLRFGKPLSLLVVPWDNFGEPAHILEQLVALRQGRRYSPTVRVIGSAEYAAMSMAIPDPPTGPGSVTIRWDQVHDRPFRRLIWRSLSHGDTVTLVTDRPDPFVMGLEDAAPAALRVVVADAPSRGGAAEPGAAGTPADTVARTHTGLPTEAKLCEGKEAKTPGGCMPSALVTSGSGSVAAKALPDTDVATRPTASVLSSSSYVSVTA